MIAYRDYYLRMWAGATIRASWKSYKVRKRLAANRGKEVTESAESARSYDSS